MSLSLLLYESAGLAVILVVCITAISCVHHELNIINVGYVIQGKSGVGILEYNLGVFALSSNLNCINAGCIIEEYSIAVSTVLGTEVGNNIVAILAAEPEDICYANTTSHVLRSVTAAPDSVALGTALELSTIVVVTDQQEGTSGSGSINIVDALVVSTALFHRACALVGKVDSGNLTLCYRIVSYLYRCIASTDIYIYISIKCYITTRSSSIEGNLLVAIAALSSGIHVHYIDLASSTAKESHG